MKIKLVAALVLSLAVFTGCGAKEEAPKTEATTEGTTTDATVKKSEIALDKDTLVTEISFDAEGNPVDVQIDIIMENGKSKYDEAKAGNYVMVEGSDNTWDVQIDAIEAFIVENNFEISGVDAVTGVSIAVPGVLAGVEEILAQ